ncbi:hypothetical protein WMF17_01750 [Sorangium sp. So ce362]
MSVEAIATTLNTLIGGGRIAKYNDDGRRIGVRARLLAEQRSRPEDLARLRTRRAGRSAPASTAHPATPQQ